MNQPGFNRKWEGLEGVFVFFVALVDVFIVTPKHLWKTHEILKIDVWFVFLFGQRCIFVFQILNVSQMHNVWYIYLCLGSLGGVPVSKHTIHVVFGFGMAAWVTV